MTSQTSIANGALIKLGATRITSLDDGSKSSRLIMDRWDALRDDELRRRRWVFAIKRTSLSALSDAPDHGFALQYQLPTDFLRLDLVDDRYPAQPTGDYIGDEAAEWAIEGRKLLTDLPAPLKIRYGARIEDVTQWDTSFCEVMSCRIALDLCEAITQSGNKWETRAKEYQQAVRDALRANAFERAPVAVPDDSWMMSRL